MNRLQLFIVVTLLLVSFGGLQAQNVSATRLIDVPAKAFALTQADQDFLDKRSRDPYVDWAIPVVVDSSALNYEQFNVYLYDQSVMIRKRHDLKGSRQFPGTWLGEVVLPDDPADWDHGGLRDVLVSPSSGGGLFATIRVGEIIYRVSRLPSGVQFLTRQDASKIHDSPNDILFPDIRIEPPLSHNKAVDNASSTIRLMIGFTSSVLSEAGGLSQVYDLIGSAVQMANLSYESNDISLELDIASYARPFYAESSVQQALIDLYYSQEGMWLPHVAREETYADVMVMVVNSVNDPICGLAPSIGSTKETAMFVVQLRCLGSHTLAHELGHLMWADHNLEDAFPDPFFNYEHGYRRESEDGVPGWSTVMSVTQTCQSACPRLNRWSSPLYEQGGEPMGTAEQNDNARVINQTKSIVAGFYPDPPPELDKQSIGVLRLYTPDGVFSVH